MTNPVRQAKREVIANAKARPCTDCGVQYPPYVMQFDHVGVKHFPLHSARVLSHSLEEILAEIELCDVVCANCHCERTQQRRFKYTVEEHAVILEAAKVLRACEIADILGTPVQTVRKYLRTVP